MNSFQEVFDRQKRYFATGVTRSYGWRIEQLDRMVRLVGENEIALQEAIAKDFKTASQEQIFETLACLGEVGYQKSQLKGWMAPTEAPVPRALAATGHRGVIYRDPYGVALIIGPFNGPLTLLLRPAITALAAGNCCVLKLSMALKATSSLLLDLVPKYFQPEAVVAVAGHREETTELLKLPFDFIFFTGSTSTGKVIARAAAENLTPVLLELGGQADPNARYLDPTIVYPVSWDDPIMEEEVFGPILPILTYRTLDEAFSRISATPLPLAAFIFSRSQSAIDRFIGELSFGGGAVNQVNIHLFVETMPFGGVGSSGMGHYYGKYGFDMLTHAKSMLISPPDVAIDHLFPPYTAAKNEALKAWFEY
jgi:acyl-CoA reductase-like NAD-dependent aldehyde dehydrogenase